MYCNTHGCNSQRVPWSEPVVAEERQPRVHQEQGGDDHVEIPLQSETDSKDFVTRAENDRFMVPIDSSSQPLSDDLRLLALLDRSAARNPDRGTRKETERRSQVTLQR